MNVPTPAPGRVERRRILLSSFACSPLWGSEPGVGWQWLLQLIRHHEVVLLTHEYFRSHLEPALAQLGLTVEIHYLQAPAFGLHPHRQLNSRLYYTWWQWHLRRLAQRLLAGRRFDVIHHLTWGTLRFPCFLGGLSAPLVMGPLGGGERAPLRFFQGLPLPAKLFDVLRSLTLLGIKLDPLATTGPRRSALVLCKSSDSLRALPASVQRRAIVVPEIGSPPVAETDHPRSRDPSRRGPYKLLFAGRLLGWKGVQLALGATSLLLRGGHDVQLDVAGDGPLRGHLARRIEKGKLQGRIRLLGKLPRHELMDLYSVADLFVFPSLHDSSGNVVLESLAHGLPVVCLDLGGPQLYLDESCGVVVSTSGLSRQQLEQSLADAIARLLQSPEHLARLSLNAKVHARKQSWEATVERAYGHIWRQLPMSP